MLTPLLLTLKVAGWATLIASVFGTGLAWVLARTRFPGREWLDACLTLPMVLPPTVLGYYLLVVFGAHGVLGTHLQRWFGIRLVFSWQGAVLAAAIVALPLVLKPARAAFESVDTHLEDTASSLGLTGAAIFWRITLPLAWPGILSGVTLAFARALGEFGATLMVAGSIPGETQTLSLAVYEAVQAGNDVLANQLVILISAVCLLALVLSRKMAHSGKAV
ncbi:molybdate ABC transporter permease subunit [Burkholderiaceae bacterium DAT-1]|nr:molybdate ABC transporter permease subunit [Burkholderiaceae bacterium DAT-1]